MHHERGDVITAYLLRLVGGLAIAGLLLIEGTAVTLNRIGLEEATERAARHGAAAYAEHGTTEAVERAAEQRLDRADAVLVDAAVTGDVVRVTATRSAKVVVSDRIDLLSDLVSPARTEEAVVSR